MASNRKYHLPVHVSDEVLEKNPKFSHLLRILSSKLTSNGVTVSTKQEMEMAEKNICLARQGWLMNHVPYYELRELITELEVKSMEGALSLDEEQLTEVLSEAVAFGELGDYLSLPSSSPSQNPTLMGLSLEDLDRHNPTKKHLPVIQRAVLPMLEERLHKKYKEIHNVFAAGKECETRSEKERTTLPSLVEERKQQLTREKASLQMLKEKKRESFLLYYQTLLQCLSLMDRLIGHHKLGVQSASDRLCVDWMEAWCVAVCTRAKLILLQLGCDAYTPRNVSALKVIRGHLDKAIGDAERELSQTKQQVGAYRSVGVEFKSLVDQYTALKKEIDDCSWGLQQFAQQGQNAS